MRRICSRVRVQTQEWAVVSAVGGVTCDRHVESPCIVNRRLINARRDRRADTTRHRSKRSTNSSKQVPVCQPPQPHANGVVLFCLFFCPEDMTVVRNPFGQVRPNDAPLVTGPCFICGRVCSFKMAAGGLGVPPGDELSTPNDVLLLALVSIAWA